MRFACVNYLESGRRQGARCDELSVDGDRACRALREAGYWGVRFTLAKAAVCQAWIDVVGGVPRYLRETG